MTVILFAVRGDGCRMALYEASFKLRHECPYRELSERSPELTIREWPLQDCQVLEVTARDADPDDIVGAIEGIGEVLHRVDGGDGVQLVARSCECPLDDSIVQRFERHGCLYTPPTVYRHGWEHYSVIAFDEDDVLALLDELDGDREIEVTAKTALEGDEVPFSSLFSTEQLFDGVTDRQLAALRLAIDEGYFDEPRGTSVAELAERTAVARATYEAHLRKAQNRVMGNVAQFVRLVAQRRGDDGLLADDARGVASRAVGD